MGGRAEGDGGGGVGSGGGGKERINMTIFSGPPGRITDAGCLRY